jgi:hypothetical protein
MTYTVNDHILSMSATVWVLGYMTQIPSHLSLTPGYYVRGLAPTTLACRDIDLSSRSTIHNTIHPCSIPSATNNLYRSYAAYDAIPNILYPFIRAAASVAYEPYYVDASPDAFGRCP